MSTKRLYHDNGFINEKYICERPEPFCFQIGPRGTGKTYGIMQWLHESEKKFIFMRRTQTEADAIGTDVSNPFKALMNDTPGLDIAIAGNRKNIKIFAGRSSAEDDYKTIGYLVSLSTFASIKGMDFSDVEVIFYDEFIPEHHQRPIKDEFLALMNVYESVNRNRELRGLPPVKMICAANSTDITNPVFIGLEIVERIARMMEKGIEYYSDTARGLAVYMFMHSPISEKKGKTALYQLTAGSSFQDMALRNLFDIDKRYISSRPLKEYKPAARYGELCIYEHKSRNELYIRGGSSGTMPAVYQACDTDKKRFIKRYPYFYIRYLSGHAYFETVTAQILFEKIYT